MPTITAGGWNAVTSLVASQVYSISITPPASGFMLVEWSADGVVWTALFGSPFSRTFVGAVPQSALFIRAQATGGSGDVTVTRVGTRGSYANTLRVGSVAALGELAAASALDLDAIYLDVSTGARFVAVSATDYVSLGANLVSAEVNFVESGLLIPASGAIAAAVVTAGVVWIDGVRVVLPITSLALSATSDNYVDVSRSGTITVTAVPISDPAPVLAAGSLRLGFCATDASTVTARTIQAADSLDNWMYNTVRVPGCKLRHTNGAGFSGFAGLPVPVDFLSPDVFDNAGLHSPSLNSTRIVFPTPGMYAIQASVQFLAAITLTGTLELGCYVSTGGGAAAEDPTFPKDVRNPGGDAVLSLAIAGTVLATQPGDYAEVYVIPNGAGGALIASWLNCSKVG